MGDPHGAWKAILQVFERSVFDYEKDKLIVLGDVCDGWYETFECVEELLKIKNLLYILGNHDSWCLNYGTFGVKPDIWTSQGGKATIASYLKHGGMPESHIKLFRTAPVKYVENNRLFVHGGIDLDIPFDKQDIDTFLWDRYLIKTAVSLQNTKPDAKLTDFDEVFVGHTTTQFFDTVEPIHACNIWDLDTGAGWLGKLTLMNVDSKEYWQSDYVYTLYPGIKGRGG